MPELIVTVIFLLAAFGILFWFMQKVPIPAPFIYIVYAVMALVSLSLLWHITGGIASPSIMH